VDRRAFLKTTLLGTGVAAGLSVRPLPILAEEASAPAKGTAMLKLCSQDSNIPGKSVKEKTDNILKFGGAALEFGGLDVGRARQIRKDLQGTGVAVAALCAGYFPLIDPDPQKRQEGVANLKKMLEAAGEAGAGGVIVVPAFNQHPQLEFDEGRKVLVDLLPAVGEYAVKCNTRVLLEPLNRGEAKFLNQLAPAAAICRDVGSPGIAMMGDFYHMAKEEKDDEAAFLAGEGWVHHVHLASRARNLPGQDNRSFVSGFRGLKRIGFQDYCSLECTVKGDAMVEIPKSFEFLKQQWAEAKA
jgi:sugar phosphate isomerase/epimerase